MTKKFDVSKFKSVSTELKIVYPQSGEFSGLTLTVIGINSEPMQLVVKQIDQDRQKLLMRRKTFTNEQVEANQIKLYLTSVTGWNWGVGDADPIFTKKALKELLESAPDIKDQIDEVLSVKSNFFPD